jgi:hypothetical protein
MNNQPAEFCDATVAGVILGCSDRTLLRYRQQNKLLFGIHWGRNPSGKVLYNINLLNHLIVCGGNVNHLDHQRFIERYLSNRPENQPQKPGPKLGKKRAVNLAIVQG